MSSTGLVFTHELQIVLDSILCQTLVLSGQSKKERCTIRAASRESKSFLSELFTPASCHTQQLEVPTPVLAFICRQCSINLACSADWCVGTISSAIGRMLGKDFSSAPTSRSLVRTLSAFSFDRDDALDRTTSCALTL